MYKYIQARASSKLYELLRTRMDNLDELVSSVVHDVEQELGCSLSIKKSSPYRYYNSSDSNPSKRVNYRITLDASPYIPDGIQTRTRYGLLEMYNGTQNSVAHYLADLWFVVSSYNTRLIGKYPGDDDEPEAHRDVVHKHLLERIKYCLNSIQKCLDEINAHEIRGNISKTWYNLLLKLKDDMEEYDDPFYEGTAACDKLTDIMVKVDISLGIYVEPSVQGGIGTVLIASRYDDRNLVEGLDYNEFNRECVKLAMESASRAEFCQKYKEMIQSKING